MGAAEGQGTLFCFRTIYPAAADKSKEDQDLDENSLSSGSKYNQIPSAASSLQSNRLRGG